MSDFKRGILYQVPDSRFQESCSVSNFKKGILYQVPDFKKDSERPILTQNSKFDPLRVKISNESQLIRDFQGKLAGIHVKLRILY